MHTRLLFVHALSPLHAGTGQSIGAVDLAIARDRATDHPYLPGSSLKGALRDVCDSGQHREHTQALFGPPTENASDHAGALAFGDANLLLLPVRSVAGTFSWATSPFLLSRYARDAREAGVTDVPAVPANGALGGCAITATSALKVGAKVIFEDLDFTPDAASTVTADAWAKHLGGALFPNDPEWQKQLVQRLCIVADDVMTFLGRHGTDVVTRVALDPAKKTVKKGQLWTEESLPVETVLVALVAARPNAGSKGLDGPRLLDALRPLLESSVQLGGKSTVGRGRCRLVLSGGAA